MTDEIEIHGLQLDSIVGLRPEERTQEQPIRLNVVLELDLSAAGRSGRISETCDYDKMAGEIRALLDFRRYRLIESAVEEISAMLLAVYPQARRVRLRLEKPRALDGRAEYASVSIARTRDDFPRRFEQQAFGQVEVVLETKDAGLYLLHVDGSRAIPRHHHKVMRELEWLVAGELHQGGTRIELRQPMVWAREQPHAYDNLGDSRATLFCCDSPPFIPQDEIPLGDP